MQKTKSEIKAGQLRAWKEPWAGDKGHRAGMFIVLKEEFDTKHNIRFVHYLDLTRGDVSNHTYLVLEHRSELVAEAEILP